jgi:hypothetical protein
MQSYLPYLMTAASMLKGGPSMPKMKKPPVANDEAIRKAKRRSILEQQIRSGRASTILSQPDDQLGS